MNKVLRVLLNSSIYATILFILYFVYIGQPLREPEELGDYVAFRTGGEIVASGGGKSL